MQNDHDDKYEPHEESEYHFSDEEVSYEVEPEAPKAAPAGGSKESVLKQFSQRRMIISGVVFLVLVFAVYKMVSPSSTAPSTMISNAPAPTIAAAQPIATPQPAAVQQPAAAPAPVVTQPAVAMQQPAMQQPAMQQPAMQQPVVQQPEVQPVMQQPVTQTTMPQTAATQPVVTQPAYQPVTSPVATNYAQAPSAPVPAAVPVQTTLTTPAVGSLPAVSDHNLNATGNQLTTQVTATYQQKVTEFESLTEALQTQVQQLNSRVGNMETQLHQLVQILTQQQANQGQSSFNNTTNNASPLVVQQQAVAQALAAQPAQPEIRIPYNVQAIIPGRAWLKSESGETLTVAEGDVVRDIGRVVKIDPYDGVVEINTGNKVVSLSYGNTG